MTDAFFHGARVQENADLETAINDIDSTVIGLIATADDASADAFPLNTPVLITRPFSALGNCGTTGTLWKAMKAISDQVSTKVVVIRVAQATGTQGDPTQSSLVIGGTDENGNYTGMYAFLTAEQKVGYRPRILGCPDLDTAEVSAQLIVIAKQLRAYVYGYCTGCETVAEAKTYREQFAAREFEPIWPNFIAYNSQTGENEEFPAVAYAMGLRALIDKEVGWHRSLSNYVVSNVLGISKDVFWALQAEDSDANELNANEITTLIKRDGFRFWGNRTTDTETYIFEVYTRTAQILADTIAEAQFTTVDEPLTPANAKDIVSGIKGKLKALVTAGKLIGADCWFDIVDNPVTGIRQGKAVIRYNYSPCPPLEDLTMIQTFTDTYYDTAFASIGGDS